MAAQTLTGRFAATISLSEILASGLSNSQSAAGSLSIAYDFVGGTSNTALAINQEFTKSATTVTLNAAASQTYTLTSLTDDSGRSKSFANGEERAAFLAPLREVLAVKSCKRAKGFSLEERAEQNMNK